MFESRWPSSRWPVVMASLVTETALGRQSPLDLQSAISAILGTRPKQLCCRFIKSSMIYLKVTYPVICRDPFKEKLQSRKRTFTEEPHSKKVVQDTIKKKKFLKSEVFVAPRIVPKISVKLLTPSFPAKDMLSPWACKLSLLLGGTFLIFFFFFCHG